MPLYSVLSYAKGQVDGTVVPHRAAAVAYLNPPVAGQADPGTLQLFVWSGDLGEKRQAFGFKKLNHTVAIYALMIDDPSDQYAGQAFFQGLDAVMAKLRAIKSSLPVTLTDPDTGVVSELTSIGEEFKVRHDVVRDTNTQRFVRYLAQISTEAFEVLQG